MLDQIIIQQALSIATDKGLEFAELFCEKTKTNSISLEDNKLDKVRNGIDSGVGFRIIDNKKTYYGYVNSLAPKDILELARTVTGYAKKGTGRKTIAQLKPIVPTDYIRCYKQLPDSIALKEKIPFLARANEVARNFDKRVVQVSVRYGDTVQEVLVANNLGVLAEDTRVRTRFVVSVVAKSGNIIQTGYEAPGGATGIELLNVFSPEEVATTAARRAILNLEADKAPAGPMTVVLAGSAGGTMVHEACGHALEADFIYKKTSIFTDTLNKKMVSDLITVIDDGTIPGNYGSLAVDDEGHVTKKNILIENGYVRNFMNDHLYGSLLNLPRTGNGRRESYRYAPMPRMTNTYIQPGKSTYEEILQATPNGLLVKKMGGGQVDITNGNFVFEVTEGYILKDGQIDRPVRGATLVGNGLEVLASVDMVGNDLYYIPGMCGKGQSAPVSDGQPTLRIPKLIVGGQQ